jgi:hypothetical protein
MLDNLNFTIKMPPKQESIGYWDGCAARFIRTVQCMTALALASKEATTNKLHMSDIVELPHDESVGMLRGMDKDTSLSESSLSIFGCFINRFQQIQSRHAPPANACASKHGDGHVMAGSASLAFGAFCHPCIDG